jgi:hypothetical protein
MGEALFWGLVALGFGVASLLGYVLLDAASPRTVAIVSPSLAVLSSACSRTR